MSISDLPHDYDDAAFSPYEKLEDLQGLAVLALHDTASTASGSSRCLTYDDILNIADELAPNFFGRLNLLARTKESDLAIEYRQRAKMESAETGKIVTPAALVRVDIQRWERYLEKPEMEDRASVKRRLDRLDRVLNELEYKHYTETQIINRDMAIGEDLPISSKGDRYLDIALPGRQVLRLRLFHPDPPENATGIDVLYEHHNIKRKAARLAAVQYKIWKKKTLYTTQSPNIEGQLYNLRKVFCENGVCNAASEQMDKDLYRLRYCSAFLRPTDRLQLADTRIASSGYHIPICAAEKLWEPTLDGKKLSYEQIRNASLTQRTFEELFNNEMLGSKWIPYCELEKLYEEHNLLKPDETVVIHAQHFVRRKR